MTAKKEEGATVGTASYDARLNGWVLFPMCKTCIQHLMRDYGVKEEE